MHIHEKAICEELGAQGDGGSVQQPRALLRLGDRKGVASTGDYGRAREMYEQHKAISEELGDRAGVAVLGATSGSATTRMRRRRDWVYSKQRL